MDALTVEIMLESLDVAFCGKFFVGVGLRLLCNGLRLLGNGLRLLCENRGVTTFWVWLIA